jgi:hypothetical protein
MNVSVGTIKDYDNSNKQPTTNVMQNKAKQSQFLYHWLGLLFIIIAPLLALARKQGGGEFDKEFCV